MKTEEWYYIKTGGMYYDGICSSTLHLKATNTVCKYFKTHEEAEKELSEINNFFSQWSIPKGERLEMKIFVKRITEEEAK